MPITWSELATLLGVLIILWKAFRLTPKEGKSLEAGIIERYEASIKAQLERYSKLEEIVKKFDAEEQSWREERNELLSTVSDLRTEVQVLQTSVDRLSAQVTSMGGTPVIKRSSKK